MPIQLSKPYKKKGEWFQSRYSTEPGKRPKLLGAIKVPAPADAPPATPTPAAKPKEESSGKTETPTPAVTTQAKQKHRKIPQAKGKKETSEVAPFVIAGVIGVLIAGGFGVAIWLIRKSPSPTLTLVPPQSQAA